MHGCHYHLPIKGMNEMGKFEMKHGLSKHPLYGTWKRMKTRCYNSKCKDYKDYGGRGITICDLWREDFVEFLYWALKNGWEKGLSLERIDCDKGYCPENCKWISLSEQSKNRRTNHLITYNGETHTIAEWSRIKGIARKTLELRLESKNFTLEEAFEKPVNEKLARR